MYYCTANQTINSAIVVHGQCAFLAIYINLTVYQFHYCCFIIIIRKQLGLERSVSADYCRSNGITIHAGLACHNVNRYSESTKWETNGNVLRELELRKDPLDYLKCGSRDKPWWQQGLCGTKKSYCMLIEEGRTYATLSMWSVTVRCRVTYPWHEWETWFVRFHYNGMWSHVTCVCRETTVATKNVRNSVLVQYMSILVW